MRRLTTFSAGSDVPAATLNGVQDEQVGLAPASQNPGGATVLRGADVRYACTGDAGLADGQLAVLDLSLDWRLRAVDGLLLGLEGASQRLHGADVWQRNELARAFAVRSFVGVTGGGAYGATGVAVAPGVPPTVSSTSYAVCVDEGPAGGRVWLYARPSDGALCLYNGSGAVLHAELFVRASGPAPTPGAPPPDVIPTLTDVLWLSPGTAAARPAEPAGPALYYATDTAAWSVWDGGVWRPLGGGGGGAATSTLVPLCTYATVDGPLTVVGRGRFDPAEHAVTGRTTQLTFDAVGDVSRVGVLGSVVLRNRTDGVNVATLTFGETDATAKRAAVPLPAGPKVFEVYAQHDGAPTDYLTLGGVGLRITWS